MNALTILTVLCVDLPGDGEVLQVVERILQGQEVHLTLQLPVGTDFLGEARVEEVYREHARSLPAGIDLVLFARRARGPSRRIESFLAPVIPPPAKSPASPAGTTSQTSGGQGFLAGKTVFLSPGHGWFHDPGDGRWETQRPVTNEIVEDFHSADVVSQHLARRLENAGASVWIVRERDRNPGMVIVDETDGNPLSGTCVETGSSARFQDSSLAGYGHGPLPHGPSTNPLALGAARLMSTTPGTSDASVLWTPNLASPGTYAVYVSFGAYSNRPSDTHYTVLHAGGRQDVHVDQTRDGFTWLCLGEFPFAAGYLPGQQGVLLSNETNDPNASWISFDAVRFGGGLGDIDAGGGVSGRPRQEECARVHTQYLGAPPSVYRYYSDDRTSDIVARPRYAAWENEVGEDSIYLSWHTNAPSPATGTSSYIYSTNPTPGSAALQSAVHAELIADLRLGYDPAWVDRGTKSAPFGEVNPAHNSEMPSMLLEAAFHSTASDALKLRDGTCVDVMTRGVTQGIARYFAQRDGTAVQLAPEPARDLVARLSPAGGVDISWSAPAAGPPGLYGDAPTSYSIHVSSTPRAFGEPLVEVTATHAHLSIPVASAPLYLRVVSVNAGGVSLPSASVAVMAAGVSGGLRNPAPARALFVAGYTRRGPYLLAKTTEQVAGSTPVTSGGDGTLSVRRRWEERINTRDYVVEHAQALVGIPGLSLDSAERGALGSGRVALTDYDLVLWAAGRQAEVFASDPVDDTSLNASERLLLQGYLAAGGRLFLSGAEVAYDLDRDADPNDAESLFLNNWLHASYVADGAGTFGVHSAGVAPFAGLAPLSFDDGTAASYAVEWPDVLAPVPGAQRVLDYDSWGGAAVFHGGTHRVIYLGFPFETIRSATARMELMRAAVLSLVSGH